MSKPAYWGLPGQAFPPPPSGSLVDDFIDDLADLLTDILAKNVNGIFDTYGVQHPGHAETVTELKPGIHTLTAVTVHGGLCLLGGGITPEVELEEVAGLTAYEVGTYDALRARSVVGDGLELHHAGQAHAMEQVVSGYSRAKGPAIVLPRLEHLKIPNLRGAIDLIPRQVLARDIWNLRRLTNAPSCRLRELVELNKQLYPEAFKL